MGKENIRTNQIIGYKPRVRPILLSDSFNVTLKGAAYGTGTETVELAAASALFGEKGLHLVTQPTTPQPTDLSQLTLTFPLSNTDRYLFEIFFKILSTTPTDQIKIALSGSTDLIDFELGLKYLRLTDAFSYFNSEHDYTALPSQPRPLAKGYWHYLAFEFDFLTNTYINFFLNKQKLPLTAPFFASSPVEDDQQTKLAITIYAGAAALGDCSFDELIISEVL